MNDETASFCYCHDGSFHRACFSRDDRDNRDDVEWFLHYNHNDADDR
ncbi:hypothetical protein X756_02675 [Mesorhizobium sp. LSHC412B00]|nr:hypothetical protein X756_02675 [Mesorhizobium sp. LSHC412B00]